MIRYFFLLVISFPPGSQAEECDSIASVDWILGNWISVDENIRSTEIWKQVSPMTFEGKGETLSTITKKLLTTETLRLIEMENEVFYLAKVSHNERPVTFKLTSCSSSMATFENSEHDFPRLLKYQTNMMNDLIVNVSDGKGKGFKVKYIRFSPEDGN